MQDIAGQSGSTPLPDPGQAGQGEAISPSAGQPGQDTGFEPVYTLDLNEVSARFDDAQLPRSRRTLLRYCQHEKLDCTKVETMHGEQYFVSEPSVQRLIAEILERERFTRPPQGDMALEAGQGAPGPTVVEPSQNQPENPQSAMDRQSGTDQGEPRQVGELAEVDERLLNQLERENGLLRDQLEKKDAQIDKKDKQIDDLIERGREDKHLIQNFQRKLGMLEAPEEGRGGPVYHSDQNRVPLQTTEPDGASDNS